MRAALISITGQPRDRSGSALLVAGKSVAERQLEFALAAGCERIIALGSLPDVIALRHAAEDAGAQFLAVGNSHGLLGTIRAADELMVIAPGLLPDERAALPVLAKSNVVLVLPATSGVAAGFERIDLERAWAGAAVVPGGLVERLAELPADVEVTSALLRVALQSRVPEARLSDRAITDGSWVIVESGDAEAVGQAWLDRRLNANASQGLSAFLVGKALRPLAPWFLERKQSFAGLAAGAVALLVGAVTASWFGYAPLGLLLVVLGALVIQLALGLLPLLDGRFRPPQRRASLILPALVDVALIVCSVLAIEGTWLHRLFPPAVLLASLYLRAPEGMPRLAHAVGDRALIAAVFAVASVFGYSEPSIMAAGLLVIGLKAARLGAMHG
ncbi:MAG: hypothetical protein J7493_04870 [Porphyrobacter sp.]|nr:hypothetical protein [Porphyrobacter sp.]